MLNRPSSAGRCPRCPSTSVNTDMNNDPDEIRAQVAELLRDHTDAGDSELDVVAARLEQAHDLLVHALESVEKG